MLIVSAPDSVTSCRARQRVPWFLLENELTDRQFTAVAFFSLHRKQTILPVLRA